MSAFLETKGTSTQSPASWCTPAALLAANLQDEMPKTVSATYHYHPLPIAGYIRILGLGPGLYHRKLEASLTPCQIDQPPLRCLYTAISYVWGDDNPSDTILLDGVSFGITTSAGEVLRRLRREDANIDVWIDAICINQQDLAERANQVSFMHKIYASAARTFVWLGPAANNSDLAMQYAASLDWRKYNEEQRLSIWAGQKLDQKTFLLDVIEDNTASRALIIACGHLLARKWFSRAWVQQEATVCLETVVACGEEVVLWDHIFALAWLFVEKWSIAWPLWLNIEPWEAFQMHRHAICTIQQLRRAHSFVNANPTLTPPFPHKVEFLYLLFSIGRPTFAKDPRDKIYAIRNMASPDSYIPDASYTIEWEDLYVNVARDFLKSCAAGYKRLESTIILTAGLANNGPDLKVPSWVPDWRQHSGSALPHHDKWYAGGTEIPKYVFEQIPKKQRIAILRALTAPDPDKACYRFTKRSVALRLIARMMDKVRGLSEVGWQLRDEDPYVKTARHLLDLDERAFQIVTRASEKHYLTGQLLEDAYAHVLIAGTGHQDKQENHVSVLTKARQWRQWLQNGCGGDCPEFMHGVEQSLVFRARKVCLTEHNLLCLVPEMTKEDDIVAIIRSVRHPVVLRPIVDGKHLLIGECYVHGFMDNQASQLIEEYKIKIREDGHQTWRLEGDIRRNGLATPAEVCHGDWLDNPEAKIMSIAKYKALIPILGERWITIV